MQRKKASNFSRIFEANLVTMVIMRNGHVAMKISFVSMFLILKRAESDYRNEWGEKINIRII